MHGITVLFAAPGGEATKLYGQSCGTKSGNGDGGPERRSIPAAARNGQPHSITLVVLAGVASLMLVLTAFLLHWFPW